MIVTITVVLTCAANEAHRAVLRDAAITLTNNRRTIHVSAQGATVKVRFSMKNEAQYKAVERIRFAYHYAMPDMRDSSIRFARAPKHL